MYVHHNVFYSTVDLTYYQIRDLDGNDQPHNSYLNILARFGILIFPIFLAAIVQPLIRIYHYVVMSYSRKSEEYTMLLLRSEEHTSELQSRGHLVCRLLLEKKNEQETKKQLVV